MRERSRINRAYNDNFDPDKERRKGKTRKRKQVKQACSNCRKAHSACGKQRPCPRCVARKEEHKCIDLPRKRKRVDTYEEPTIAPIAPASPPISANDSDNNPPSDIPSSPPTDGEPKICDVAYKPVNTRKRHRSRTNNNAALVPDFNSSSDPDDDADPTFTLRTTPLKLEAKVSISLPKVKNIAPVKIKNDDEVAPYQQPQPQPQPQHVLSSNEQDLFRNTNVNNNNNNFNIIDNSAVQPFQEQHTGDNFLFQEELAKSILFQPTPTPACPPTFQQPPIDNLCFDNGNIFSASPPSFLSPHGKLDDFGLGIHDYNPYDSDVGYAFDQFFLPESSHLLYTSPYGRETPYWF